MEGTGPGSHGDGGGAVSVDGTEAAGTSTVQTASSSLHPGVCRHQRSAPTQTHPLGKWIEIQLMKLTKEMLLEYFFLFVC